jgi:hypothetical protein
MLNGTDYSRCALTPSGSPKKGDRRHFLVSSNRLVNVSYQGWPTTVFKNS